MWSPTISRRNSGGYRLCFLAIVDPSLLPYFGCVHESGSTPFHGRGIGSDLPSPFQSLALRPLHQEPVDLLPGSGLNPADVVLEAGGTGGPLPRESSEATKALRVAQEERQLGVGQLMPVLEDGRAQDLRMAARRTCSAERPGAPWPEPAVSHRSCRTRLRIEGLSSKILETAFSSWASR